MANYHVDLVFNDGSGDYTLPLVQSISDPQEGMKATVHEGNRADGAIVIPGGKKSQEIVVTGILLADGYVDITTAMSTMRSSVTTNVATLTLKHYDGGWTNDWAYTVRRLTEIKFDENSLRTNDVEYTITFLVLAYS